MFVDPIGLFYLGIVVGAVGSWAIFGLVMWFGVWPIVYTIVCAVLGGWIYAAWRRWIGE